MNTRLQEIVPASGTARKGLSTSPSGVKPHRVCPLRSFPSQLFEESHERRLRTWLPGAAVQSHSCLVSIYPRSAKMHGHKFGKTNVPHFQKPHVAFGAQSMFDKREKVLFYSSCSALTEKHFSDEYHRGRNQDSSPPASDETMSGGTPRYDNTVLSARRRRAGPGPKDFQSDSVEPSALGWQDEGPSDSAGTNVVSSTLAWKKPPLRR